MSLSLKCYSSVPNLCQFLAYSFMILPGIDL
jgi:hypothetical protein